MENLTFIPFKLNKYTETKKTNNFCFIFPIFVKFRNREEHFKCEALQPQRF